MKLGNISITSPAYRVWWWVYFTSTLLAILKYTLLLLATSLCCSIDKIPTVYVTVLWSQILRSNRTCLSSVENLMINKCSLIMSYLEPLVPDHSLSPIRNWWPSILFHTCKAAGSWNTSVSPSSLWFTPFPTFGWLVSHRNILILDLMTTPCPVNVIKEMK